MGCAPARRSCSSIRSCWVSIGGIDQIPPHSPVLKQLSWSALASWSPACVGMNRDSLRRLATAEHHAAARRAANARCGSAAPAPPVLRRHAATLCVLRSPARRPEHVTAAADQHSVQSMTRSSNPHGTRAHWTRRRGRGRGRRSPELHRRRSPCARATLPGQLNGVFSTASCSPTTGRWATSAGPTGGHRSGRSQACCVGQGCLVGSTPGPPAYSAAVRERTRSREEAAEPFPSKSFAADRAGSKHGDH
jgi:hypothetical protein